MIRRGGCERIVITLAEYVLGFKKKLGRDREKERDRERGERE